MPRRTKAQIAAEVAEHNAEAATIPTGATYQSDVFGTVTLGENQGPSAECNGLDLYTVTHSGAQHAWTSSFVLYTFGTRKA